MSSIHGAPKVYADLSRLLRILNGRPIISNCMEAIVGISRAIHPSPIKLYLPPQPAIYKPLPKKPIVMTCTMIKLPRRYNRQKTLKTRTGRVYLMSRR
jgi:hypothetical protein